MRPYSREYFNAISYYKRNIDRHHNMEKYYLRDRHFIPYIILFFIFVSFLFINETINRLSNFYNSFDITFKQDLSLFIYFVLFLFIIIFISISFYYIYSIYIANKNNLWDSILDLNNKIKEFKIQQIYIDELKYQKDLFDFLVLNFPNKKIVRDDGLWIIHVHYSKDFILEILWPLTISWLKNFNSKFDYNSIKWNFLFILELNSKNDDLDESTLIKRNIHSEIIKNTNKKVFFIEKQIV